MILLPPHLYIVPSGSGFLVRARIAPDPGPALAEWLARQAGPVTCGDHRKSPMGPYVCIACGVEVA